MAIQHMETCSALLAIKNPTQIKTPMRYYYTPNIMAKMKMSGHTKHWGELRETGNSLTVLMGMENGTAMWEYSLAISFKVKHILVHSLVVIR